MQLSDLPASLISEVLSNLTAAELAIALRAAKLVSDHACDAAFTRMMKLSLPKPAGQQTSVVGARASLLLRMSEVRAEAQAFNQIAIGVTHYLLVVGARLHSCGLDPEIEDHVQASRSVVLGIDGDEGEEEDDEHEEPQCEAAKSMVVLPVRKLAAISVVEVAAGSVHSLALSASGAVFSFGRNSFGQLGEAITAQSVERGRGPKLVEGLPSACQRVGAGAHYSLVIDAYGGLHAFGSNHYGELGVRPIRCNVDSPVAVEQSARGRPLQQVAAGRSHTLLLSLAGTVLWACGRNEHGQLGDPYLSRPTACGWQWVQVNFEGGDVAVGPITHVACGRNHSVCVKGGNVYAWGCNDGGQSGPQSKLPYPRRNRIPAQLGGPQYNASAATKCIRDWWDDRDRSRSYSLTRCASDQDEFVSVAAGAYHTVALTSDGRAFRIGEGACLPPADGHGWAPHGKLGRSVRLVVQIAAGGRSCAAVHPSIRDAAAGTTEAVAAQASESNAPTGGEEASLVVSISSTDTSAVTGKPRVVTRHGELHAHGGCKASCVLKVTSTA